MRKLICAGVLPVWRSDSRVAAGGGDDGPTTPAVRGNWVGTITGVHAGIHLNGTCPARDEPRSWPSTASGSSTAPAAPAAGGRQRHDQQSSGHVVDHHQSPPSSCTWAAVSTFTVSTIDGTFQVQGLRHPSGVEHRHALAPAALNQEAGSNTSRRPSIRQGSVSSRRSASG